MSHETANPKKWLYFSFIFYQLSFSFLKTHNIFLQAYKFVLFLREEKVFEKGIYWLIDFTIFLSL